MSGAQSRLARAAAYVRVHGPKLDLELAVNSVLPFPHLQLWPRKPEVVESARRFVYDAIRNARPHFLVYRYWEHTR